MTIFEKCIQRLDDLMDLAMEANQTYKVVILLREFQITENEILNISPSFYNSVFRNNKQCLFIDISKMYDTKDVDGTESTHGLLLLMNDHLQELEEKSISVSQLQHIAFDKPYYYVDFQSTKEMIDYYIAKISEKADTIKSVRKLRNKHFGHVDFNKHKDLSALFQEYSVSLVDIEELLVLNSNILTALYRYFKDSDFYPLALNCEDFTNTIRCIKRYKELSEKYFEY